MPGKNGNSKRTLQQSARTASAIFGAMLYIALPGWPISNSGNTPTMPGKAVGTKTVNIDQQNRMNAVVITKIAVGGQRIQPGISSGPHEDQQGAPFQADENWLKEMSVTLLNRTDKVIVRAEIQLLFPDTGDGTHDRPITQYTISLGQRPEINNHLTGGRQLEPRPEIKPLVFAPGQSLVVQIGEYLPSIQSSVEEKFPLGQLTRVHIRRVQFYFADGMRWDDLGFEIPDPNGSGQYKNLGPRYFPGHPSQNWPLGSSE